jgi:hypothetical protein
MKASSSDMFYFRSSANVSTAEAQSTFRGLVVMARRTLLPDISIYFIHTISPGPLIRLAGLNKDMKE